MEFKLPLVYDLQSYPSSYTLDNIYQTPLKAKNLDIYLSTLKKKEPKAILVGGTPVFAGSRRTGIPFTDEYFIGSEDVSILKVADSSGYTIQNKTYRKEHELSKDPASSVIWKELDDCMDTVVLWNIFPFYPHEEKAYSVTRRLTNEELEVGYEFMLKILEEFNTIRKIIVASDLAAHVISRHEEFKNKYDVFYVSNPNICGTAEFINRVKASLIYKEEILEHNENTINDGVSYEYRQRWADTNMQGQFYCRALNQICEEDQAYFCEFCPCNLCQHLYCGYYDFNRTDHNQSLENVKRRFDLLIQTNLIPLFPDYMKRNFSNRGFVVEKAIQFAAEYYRDRTHLKSRMPYMMYILRQLHIITPYVMSLNREDKEDILVAIILKTILRDTNVSKNRIEKKFGSFVLSIIDPEHEEYRTNIIDIIDDLEDMGIPDHILETIYAITHIYDES